jgi:hypothetical protein
MTDNVHSGKFFGIILKYLSSNSRQPLREPGFDLKTIIFDTERTRFRHPVLLDPESRESGTGERDFPKLTGRGFWVFEKNIALVTRSALRPSYGGRGA